MESPLLDIKNARRNMKLRGMEGPEAAGTLKDILHQAIQMQASGSTMFQKKSLEEIKQIRQDMVAGQIHAGAKTSQMVGLYGHVIDQIESVTNKANRNNDLMMESISGFSKSIPSVDSLVGALMTANPILGLGVKVLNDLNKSRKEAKRRTQEEAKKRLTLVNEQRNYVESQMAALEDDRKEKEKSEKEKAKELALPTPVVTATSKEGEYTDVLNEIKATMNALYKVWEPASTSNIVDTSNSNTIIPIPESNGTSSDQTQSVLPVEVVERDNSSSVTVVDKIEDSVIERIDAASAIQSDDDTQLIRVTESIGEKIDNLIDTEKDLAAKAERDTKIERVKSTSTEHDFSPPDHLKSNTVSEDKGGMFGGILALLRGLGMIAGLGAGAGLLATMFSPIKALFSFIGSFGKMAMAVVGKLAVPLAVIGSIYAFFEGFFEADRILGLSDSEISIGDRISTGIANVMTSLWKWADSIVETLSFGVLGLGDTSDVDSITTNLAQRLIGIKNDLYDWFVAGFTDTKEMFNLEQDATIKDKIIGGVANLTTSAVKYADWLVETLSFGYFDLGDVDSTGFKQKVFDTLNTVTDKIYDWVFKGFVDTETIGIDNEDATLHDRIMSGFANIQASMWGLVDWLVETISFGSLDLIDTTDLPKRIYDFFQSLPTKVVEFIDSVTGSLSDSFTKAISDAVDIFKSIPEKFNEIWKTVVEKFDTMTSAFTDNPVYSFLFGDSVEQEVPTFEDPYVSKVDPSVYKEQYENYGRAFGQIHDPSESYRTTAMDEMDTLTRRMIDEKAQSNLNSYVSAPSSNITNVKSNTVEAASTANTNARLRLAW